MKYFIIASSFLWKVTVYGGLAFGGYYFIDYAFFTEKSSNSSNNYNHENAYVEESRYENEDSQSNYENEDSEFNYDNYDCDDLRNLVTSEGNRVSSISDLNSEVIDYAALYEYNSIYFVVIEFTSSSKHYIYCDIDRSNWNAFVDNDADSYGTGFHTYIRPNTHCGCSK